MTTTPSDGFEARPMVGIEYASHANKAWMVVELDRRYGFDHIIAWSYQGTPEQNEANARRVASALTTAARTDETLRVLGGARELVALLDDMPKDEAVGKAMWASLDQIDSLRSALRADEASRIATEPPASARERRDGGTS